MVKKYVITQEQSRAARGLLVWSRKKLANAAKIAERTLVDFERGARGPHVRTLARIRRALEDAGIVFIDENGGGAGVRLRDRRERYVLPK